MKPAACGFAWPLLILLLSPNWASAQRGSGPAYSHASIPPSPGAEGMKPSDILMRRFMEAQITPLMGQMQFPALTADMKSLLESPIAQEVLKKLAAGDPDLMRLADREYARQGGGQSSDVQRQNQIKELAEQLHNRSTANGQHSMEHLPFNPPPVAERERLTNRAHAENIVQILRSYGLDNVASDLRDSPVFQEWIRDLSRASVQAPNGPVTVGHLAQTVRTMDGLARDLRQWLPRNLPDMPKVDFSPPTPSFNVPSLYAPSASTFSLGGSGWTFVAFGVVVLLAIVALTRLSKLRPVKALAVSRPFALGPWPVDPQTISTREQLIAAFEYLALLKYGLTASSWHHNEVGARLAHESGQAAAAEELTGLYERARYAPNTDGPWDTARRMLAKLLG